MGLNNTPMSERVHIGFFGIYTVKTDCNISFINMQMKKI